MNIYPVAITEEEFLRAAAVGVKRQVEALKRGLKDRKGLDPLAGWGAHVLGAVMELGFAKKSKREWQAPINTFRKGADVDGIEVRGRTANWHELKVYPDDGPDTICVLTYIDLERTTSCGSFWVVIGGWAFAYEARQEKWLKNPDNRGAAYFMPQSELHDSSVLLDGSPLPQPEFIGEDTNPFPFDSGVAAT